MAGRWILTLSVLLAIATVVAPAAAVDHVFVTTSDGTAGNSAAMGIGPPWTATTGLQSISPGATLRHFLGLHWIVNGALYGGSTDDVQAIDPVTFDVVRHFSVGVGSNPRDIAVVDSRHAWVSRYDSRWLLEVDPVDGARLDSIDLGIFADADGLPEMAWMALDGTHLLVQIQRIDRPGTGSTVPPALLAVVDVATRQIIDVNPASPGVQGIELLGPEPQTKMQIEGRRLFVSTPGKFIDFAGGIEEIDLDSFANLGFLISEDEWAIDMGAFILVSPTRGYVINHTDFALSSHLDSFSRPSGAFLEEHFVSFSMIESVAYDSLTDQLFFPDPQAGMRIFRGSTGEWIGGPVSTGLPPRDLVIVRGSPTSVPPVSASLSLRVDPNPFHGTTTISCTARVGGPLTITIHDVHGRTLRRLGSNGGRESTRWDGRDDSGRTVSAGVYLVQVRAHDGALIESRRVVRLR